MLSRKKKNIQTLVQAPEPPLPLPSQSGSGHRKKDTKTNGQQQHFNKISGSKLPKNQPPPPLPPHTIDVGGQAIHKDRMLNGLATHLTRIINEEDDVKQSRVVHQAIICLNDWTCISDQSLIKLTEELRVNVNELDSDILSPIVSGLMNGDWVNRSVKVIQNMEYFISDLLRTKPIFGSLVLRSVISKFIVSKHSNQVPDQDPCSVSDREMKAFDVVHRNMQSIFELNPKLLDKCVKYMNDIYPYMGRAEHVHYCYVYNILYSISYLPEFRMSVLSLLVHKLTRIDVSVSPEDISHTFEVRTRLKEQDIKPRIKQEDGSYMDLELALGTNSSAEVTNPLVDVLDTSLDLVFQYLSTEFVQNECIFQEGSEFEAVFESLCLLFEKEILLTFDLRSVQFLFMYLFSCNLSYCLRFLDFLWQRACNPDTITVVRIQAMSYLSAFLSRAKYIPIKNVKRWLSRMSEWANHYVDHKMKNAKWSSINLDAHGPFYAVCQTLFYVFTFRNKELIASRRCILFTRTLNLGRLVMSELNPLKACVEVIAEAFVEAAHVHQISYCSTVLERNQKATLILKIQEEMELESDQREKKAVECLEAFFPFDPILLIKCKAWIDPIYRSYEPYVEEVKMEKVEPVTWSGHDEDSIEMELSVSFDDRSTSTFISDDFNTSK